MNELEATGRYQVREDIFTSVREDFAGGYCDDAACAQSMREFYEQSGYVMDPHTAIAYKVMKDYEKEDSMHKCVLLSTASPCIMTSATSLVISTGYSHNGLIVSLNTLSVASIGACPVNI